MERYRRAEKHKSQQTLKDNEIRITAKGLVRNYISYALSLLQDQKTNEIVLKAMGQAISKTVGIAEIIKKRNPGLHQDIVISSMNITDVWEPVEEGLIPLEISRQVSLMSITLSIAELDKSSPGYQAPFHKGSESSGSGLGYSEGGINGRRRGVTNTRHKGRWDY